MKKGLTLILLVASMGVFSGCNTINGIGLDVERAGAKVQDAARR